MTSASTGDVISRYVFASPTAYIKMKLLYFTLQTAFVIAILNDVDNSRKHTHSESVQRNELDFMSPNKNNVFGSRQNISVSNQIWRKNKPGFQRPMSRWNRPRRTPGQSDDSRYVLQRQIEYIGYFLASHKYFELDRRYIISDDQNEKPVFYKHFPLPRLRRLHPNVQKACDQGFLTCIDEIYKTANISESLYKLHKNTINLKQPPKLYPFKYAREIFRYRTTASYYMCWYTMREEQPLDNFASKSCFRHFHLVTEAKKRKINDFRSLHGNTPFQCALLWFCPNQCYGKLNGNVRNKNQGLHEKTNPCVNLANKECILPRNKNTNFDDLIKNRINVSCRCGSGIEWNTRFSRCIDTDECYDKVDICWKSGLVCQNTKGSYTCRCRLGFSLNQKTQQCEMNEILHPGAANSLKTRSRKKDHKKTFSEKIQIWFGLLNGSENKQPQYILLMMYLIVTLFCYNT